MGFIIWDLCRGILPYELGLQSGTYVKGLMTRGFMSGGLCPGFYVWGFCSMRLQSR